MNLTRHEIIPFFIALVIALGVSASSGCGADASAENPKGHIECGDIQIHGQSTVLAEVPNKDGSFLMKQFSSERMITHHDLSPGSSQYVEFTTVKEGERTIDVLNVHLVAPNKSQPSSSPSDNQRIIPVN